MSLLSWIILAIAVVPTLLTATWFVEVVAGIRALRRPLPSRPLSGDSGRVAILIPAHNEGKGLLPTIHDAQAQLRHGDRILVVADNCVDDTAECARAAGVDVVVRTDPSRRGKGYALEFGVRELSKDPPDVVIVMDADCRIDPGTVGILAQGAMQTGRPAQALYFMEAPEGEVSKMHVAEFAYRIRNWLRPLGMFALGLPTPLFGTGMAFPFGLIAGRDLGNSRLAEDTALGLDLAAKRRAPLFYPDARITSWFPTTQKAADAQRLRWEKGNFMNAVEFVPGALARAAVSRNAQLAVLAADLAVPPLAMLAFANLVCVLVAGFAALLGGSAAALAVAPLGLVMLVLGGLLSWVTVGRDLLPARELALLPVYLLGKMLFYKAWVGRKTTSEWVKTDRA